MFVLDFVPDKYLKGGESKSVVVFTAGWAMKFVPLLGKALKDMAISGKSEYAYKEFAMTRSDPSTGQTIIIDVNNKAQATRLIREGQAEGSSMRSVASTA